MSQPRRELPQRGQPLRAPRLCLRLLQPAIGLRQPLRQVTIQLRLMQALLRKTVHHHRRQKEKQYAQRQITKSLWRQLIFLHRRIEIRAISRRRKKGPKQRQPGPAIKRRSNHRQVINRIVAAVDPNFAGVIDQQRRQQYLEQDDVRDAALGKIRDQPRLEQLNDADGQQDQLLVPFELRGEHGQSGKKDQPYREPHSIQAAESPGLRVDNERPNRHALPSNRKSPSPSIRRPANSMLVQILTQDRGASAKMLPCNSD